MIQITPVGVLAERPFESREFYRHVLKIERVQTIGQLDGHAVLRLDSPRIEIDSTLVATFDRGVQQFSQHNQRLRLICKTLENTISELNRHGVSITSSDDGKYEFVDMNGLNWHLSDLNGRKLSIEGLQPPA
ncbi:MAG: hypothetical protein EOM80_03540 [Erysipelotrichia bacterium]|nr:hypothetical protein [Erysipelotrichia bacterium]